MNFDKIWLLKCPLWHCCREWFEVEGEKKIHIWTRVAVVQLNKNG